ncbi:MAG: hypothetical protein A2939_03580 [Parcubacteria group bacterium RIFCSPLOWO2_01_FULL_48_18]|nr:MAG: hypothetical protein A2939_03580 [Parcubacteria group bacterium RIFCSPLOWO2_01_FULL_48_18]
MVAASAVGLFLFKNRVEENVKVTQSQIHRYGDPETSIEKVRIKAFYVVPTDQNEVNEEKWRWLRARMIYALDQAALFHEVQFRRQSAIVYDIYPNPVILSRNSDYYDAGSRTVILISNEIEKRVFRPSGDLYDESFVQSGPSEYNVIGLVYEGPGGWGGAVYESGLEDPEKIADCLGISPAMVAIVEGEFADGFFLVSNKEYFFDPNFRSFGTSIVYHELGHAMGLPDRYVSKGIEIDNVSASCDEPPEQAAGVVSVRQTNDIMGLGRFKPIEINYIDRELTREMGLVE